MRVLSDALENNQDGLQMNICQAAFRPLPTEILFMTFTLGLVMSQAALAELSDEPLLGPCLNVRPAYDGSASQHAELVPVVRYFGQTWFVRSTQGILEGGIRTELVPGLNIGGQIAYEPGRKTSESSFLKSYGISDVDSGASLGAHLEWNHKFGPMPVMLLARARQHTKSDRGAQADLRLSAGIYGNGSFSAGVFTQATWANAKSTRSIYDITPQQSTATGLPAYSAGSGWLFASFGLLWSVDLNPKWVVVGSIESRRLQGDATSSPLVERKSNYYASAGLAYRF
jgi:outer membrane scaffolding protein for murein synthesis (MipA/OmpV family)